jgi:hypothetical protein
MALKIRGLGSAVASADVAIKPVARVAHDAAVPVARHPGFISGSKQRSARAGRNRNQASSEPG